MIAATDEVMPSGSSTRSRISSCAGVPVTRSSTSADELVRVVRVPEVLSRSERRRQRPQEVSAPRAGRGVFRAGGQAAGVRQQVVQRDRTERLRQLQPRQQLVHRDVQIQASRLHLLQDDDRRERLGDRADHEPRLGTDGRAAATSANPRTTTPEGLVPVGDGDRGAGGVRDGEVVLERGADPFERVGEARHRIALPRGRTARALERPSPASRCRARCSRRSSWRSRRGSTGGRLDGVRGTHQRRARRRSRTRR